MVESISLKQVSLCGGIVNVIFNVSFTHPKIIWYVNQFLSHASSFFRDRTSFLSDKLVVSRGQNTVYSAWNKVRQKWCYLWAGP